MTDTKMRRRFAGLRRVPMRAQLLVAASLGLLAGAWLFGGDVGPPAAERPATDENASDAADLGEARGEPTTTWTCSMHPQVRADEPGACPICGMDLVAVPMAAEPTTTGGGDARPTQITLSPRARARARIRTTPVRRLGDGHAERRLLGRVEVDETAERTVTAWMGGRIDRLLVRATGERIARGQVIARLYSPEVYGAHQDLLSARAQVARLAAAGAVDARAAARAALDAAQARLRLLGVPPPELRAMARAERPTEHVLIRSPFSGTVIERIAREGTYVTTGSGLYRLADLRRLWVQLDAYESDLPLLRVGQPVWLRFAALPGRRHEGRVSFVDPVLNTRTRTAQVRVEVHNEHGELRPGMFAYAVVAAQAASGSDAATDAATDAGHEPPLVVPATAPLFTGRRSLVYVELPNAPRPTYEARVVRLGARLAAPGIGAIYPVLAGLAEGERVVVHGAFTLDADLQLRGGRGLMDIGNDTLAAPVAPAPPPPPAKRTRGDPARDGHAQHDHTRHEHTGHEHAGHEHAGHDRNSRDHAAGSPQPAASPAPEHAH